MKQLSLFSKLDLNKTFELWGHKLRVGDIGDLEVINAWVRIFGEYTDPVLPDVHFTPDPCSSDYYSLEIKSCSEILMPETSSEN